VLCYPLQVTPHLSITQAPHALVISQKSSLSRGSEIVWFEPAESFSMHYKGSFLQRKNEDEEKDEKFNS
jgi:hypothetical protein